jgi:hypothetical protein
LFFPLFPIVLASTGFPRLFSGLYCKCRQIPIADRLYFCWKFSRQHPLSGHQRVFGRGKRSSWLSVSHEGSRRARADEHVKRSTLVASEVKALAWFLAKKTM